MCFSCGRIGHWKEGFPYTVKATTPNSTPEREPTLEEKGNDVMEGKNSQMAGTSSIDLKDKYGPWLLVKHKKARKKGGVPRTFSKKVDLGLKPSTNPPSKCQIIREPLPSPSVSSKVACGPVDGNRRTGRFDNPKTTSDSREKACPITSEIILPQARSFSFLHPLNFCLA